MFPNIYKQCFHPTPLVGKPGAWQCTGGPPHKSECQLPRPIAPHIMNLLTQDLQLWTPQDVYDMIQTTDQLCMGLGRLKILCLQACPNCLRTWTPPACINLVQGISMHYQPRNDLRQAVHTLSCPDIPVNWSLMTYYQSFQVLTKQADFCRL